MRLSPLLVAFLAASATVGLSHSVKAQAPPLSSTDTTSTEAIATDSSFQSTLEQEEAPTNSEIAVSPDSEPLSPVDLLTTPPLFAQGASEQESPDRIRVNPLAPTAPQQTTPTFQLPTSPTAPATPTPETAPSDSVTPVPTTPTAPSPAAPSGSTEAEPRVLVGEVLIKGADQTLQDEVYGVIKTQPGRTTTRSQLQEDINAIFATGFFSNVKAVPEDTPLGVRVTFEVQVNPVLQSVKVEGNRVLPEKILADSFGDQYGQVLNLNRLQDGIKKVNEWYQKNGYVLAQVLDAPAVSPEGIVTLQVAEGEVEGIRVRFINKDGDDKDAKGNPIRGRTRDFIVTREFQTKPGDIFNRTIVEQDLQRAFGLGIFEDVRLSLQPSETDPRKVVVVANVAEKNAGSIFASAGISSASGLFGSVGYQQQNLGGNNQKLSAEVQIGQRELLFDLSFTDPWIGGDPFRTSYTINLFRRRTISLIFDGGESEVNLPNGDTPRILRSGGFVSFTRPLSRNVFQRAEWTASLGLQYQRISIRDRDGELSPLDERRNNLSFSGTGRDDLLALQFGIVQDRRNDFARPTSGSFLRLGTEQSIPLGSGNILFNRLRGNYSFYIPVQLVKFTKGCRVVNPRPSDCPQTLAFNVQGGNYLGDLPPYEAFPLGGANSVRGYDEGDLGSVRSFVQGTIEYRFPVISIFSGALFVDGAYGFGSQGLVPGNPGGIRGKPGSGYGYGAGVRVQSPLGPIRVDFGVNDQGDTRINFGIGERF
ncbi:BamA/TamA family outer membrane protein [Phormidium sp. CLA17]|uniref:BamA/TamA family outer membrane protein n=1 Tax=Leptolyngbya sp. Cla-17 TaxID=2803751 RepID=UPI0014912762|nr:BamA/TamA family outer membrane protein [Leptolyngbya sp. Cla-17]MBM0742945.1 BamA/TamA family outer membrane protein [Leptolyngbya sp. Cla-17]